MKPSALQLLGLDAALLARQFDSHLRQGKYSIEQRRAWAQEAAAVLKGLADEIERTEGQRYAGDTSAVQEWNRQQEAGTRPATLKAPQSPSPGDK